MQNVIVQQHGYDQKTNAYQKTKFIRTGKVIDITVHHASEIHQAIRYGLSGIDIRILLIAIDMSDKGRSGYLITVNSSHDAGSGLLGHGNDKSTKGIGGSVTGANVQAAADYYQDVFTVHELYLCI